MKPQLFPKEIIEYSTESHFSDFSVTGKAIYLSVMIFLLSALIALPFIYVDISVQSNGLIRPLIDKSIITAPVSGRVEAIYIEDNLSVKHDQTLVILKSPILEEQIHTNKNRSATVDGFVKDLKLLISEEEPVLRKLGLLQTPLYKQAYLHFKLQLSESNIKYTKAKKEFDRKKLLYEEKVIARVEFDEAKFKLDQASSDINLLKKSQISKWQSELNAYQQELTGLEAEYRRLQKEKERYVIKAPLSGTIQNFNGLYSGSFIAANQKIAEISPDSGLVVECFVPPADIGLLKVGTPARFQIDAFNYNEWGIITGKIVEISNDIVITDGQPVFKIRCFLDKNFLKLNNGYIGKVKKGMTLRARFLIAERNLFQLLYDNVDDWLNPNQKDNSTSSL